jgi:hypothetical protein
MRAGIIRNSTSRLVCFLILNISLPASAATIVAVDINFSKNDEATQKKQIVTIDGERVWFDFLGTATEKTEQTPYLLTVDGGKNYMLGNVQKGNVYCARVEPDDFFKRFGTVLSDFEKIVKPETLDLKLEKTQEGPGPTILGYPTTHVRLVMTGKGQAAFLFK